MDDFDINEHVLKFKNMIESLDPLKYIMEHGLLCKENKNAYITWFVKHYFLFEKLVDLMKSPFISSEVKTNVMNVRKLLQLSKKGGGITTSNVIVPVNGVYLKYHMNTENELQVHNKYIEAVKSVHFDVITYNDKYGKEYHYDVEWDKINYSKMVELYWNTLPKVIR